MPVIPLYHYGHYYYHYYYYYYYHHRYYHYPSLLVFSGSINYIPCPLPLTIFLLFI